MPSWVAARLASRLSTARSSAAAFIRPAVTSSATRLRRTATSENSAATKKPFAATRSRTDMIPKMSTQLPSSVGMIPPRRRHAPVAPSQQKAGRCKAGTISGSATGGWSEIAAISKPGRSISADDGPVILCLKSAAEDCRISSKAGRAFRGGTACGRRAKSTRTARQDQVTWTTAPDSANRLSAASSNCGVPAICAPETGCRPNENSSRSSVSAGVEPARSAAFALDPRRDRGSLSECEAPSSPGSRCQDFACAQLDFFMSLSTSNPRRCLRPRSTRGRDGNRSPHRDGDDEEGSYRVPGHDQRARAAVLNDPIGFRILDSRFHEKLYTIAGNAVLHRGR